MSDLSSGIFALLGAVVGGVFTARAATSASRLLARAEGFEVWTQVERHWIDLSNVAETDWNAAGTARDFHQAQRRTMFLAGVPLDHYDAVRAGQLVSRAYAWRNEDLPDAVWFYDQWHQRLVQDYLETPWRARFLDHSPKLWLVRRRWRKGRHGYEVPAV